MNALTILAKLPVWIQHAVAWIGLVVAVLLPVSLFIHALGASTKSQKITKAAEWVDHFTVALVQFGKELYALLPKDTATKIVGSTIAMLTMLAWPAVLFAMLVLMGGCSTLEPPRAPRPGEHGDPGKMSGVLYAAADPARCQTLENRSLVFGGVATVSGTAGLGGALGAIPPADNRTLRVSLAIGTAVFACLGALMAYEQGRAASAFVGEGCGAVK